MSRIRTIKPDFWVDDKIVLLDFKWRLLFIGLWNFCDDDGYCENNPRKIKMQVFPGDDLRADDVAGGLTELLEHGFVELASSDQGDLLHIVNWKRHQKVNRRTATTFTNITPRQGVAHDRLTEDSVSAHGGLTEDSLREGNGREGKGREHTARTRVSEPAPSGAETAASATAPADREPAGFAAWWATYPKKTDKGHARRAYRTALKKCPPDRLLTALKVACNDWRTQNTERRFIPNPATWLNGERWEDNIGATPEQLEPDYWQPGPPPPEIADDPQAAIAWTRQAHEEHQRQRIEEAARRTA